MSQLINEVYFHCPFCDSRAVAGTDSVTGQPHAQHGGGVFCAQWSGNTPEQYLALPEVILAIEGGTGFTAQDRNA